MLKLTCLLALCLAAAGVSAKQQRIVGGSLTTIGQYPFMAAVLVTDNNVSFRQNCGGTIINNRSVMSAAHCWVSRTANQQRIRVGSSYGNSGGSLHNVAQLITHPNYNVRNQDNDVGIIRVTIAFPFGTNVQAAGIASANFNIADNQAVWAAGWGLTSAGGSPSEQLRHVQMLTINQNTCRWSFNILTENMLCAGWPTPGRSICSMDSGGPLVFNNAIVGVTSMSTTNCGGDGLPSIFVRVSRVSEWIRANA